MNEFRSTVVKILAVVAILVGCILILLDFEIGTTTCTGASCTTSTGATVFVVLETLLGLLLVWIGVSRLRPNLLDDVRSLIFS